MKAPFANCFKVRLWKEAAAFMQRKYKLGDEKNPSTRFVPEIVTIDSSQGREADVVFVDCSVQSPKVLGRQSQHVMFSQDANRYRLRGRR